MIITHEWTGASGASPTIKKVNGEITAWNPLSGIGRTFEEIWRQPDPPPGANYAWLGEPHRSVSVRYDTDGNEIARNVIHDGRIIRGQSSEYVEANRGRVNIAGEDRIDLQLYGQNDLIHRENAVYVLSFWAQKHSGTITHLGGHTVPTFMDTEAYMDGEYVPGTWATGISGLGIHDNEPHFFEVKLTARYDTGTPMGNGGVYLQPNRQNFGPYYELELWDIALQSRPADAPELDSTYFDGDTTPDRANDLWYNTDGAPHEWVDDVGWVEIIDERFKPLPDDFLTLPVDLKFNGDTLDYSTNPPLLYHNGEWQEYVPKLYI